MIDTKEMEKLPEGWKRIKLGEIIIESNKSPFKVEDADNNGYYPFFTSGEAILTHSDYLVDCENLFLSTGGTAYIGYYKGKAAYSADTYAIKSKIITKYLYYFLSKQVDEITYRYFIGSGLEHLQKDFFKKDFEILFPENQEEQEKIAEILETVDNTIEKTDAIIEKYKRIKQGIMQELLTKGIDENWEVRSEKTHKFKDSPLGKITEEWEVKKLGEINHIIMGQSPNSSLVNKIGNGIAFLQGNAEFTDKYPNPTNWIEKPLKIANKGNILISVRAPIGALNITDRQYCIGRGLASIEPYNNLTDKFYLWNFIHFHINELIKLGQGSTFEAIGSKELFNLQISLPPLPEQERIASVLSQVDAVIEKETAYRDKLSRIKQGLMEDILTGKVRVTTLLENKNNQYQKEVL